MLRQGGGSSDFAPLMDRIAVDAALAGSDAGFDGRRLEVRSVSTALDCLIRRRLDHVGAGGSTTSAANAVVHKRLLIGG